VQMMTHTRVHVRVAVMTPVCMGQRHTCVGVDVCVCWLDLYDEDGDMHDDEQAGR